MNHADTIGAMGLSDRFKKQASHDGARLPIAGTEVTPVELYRSGPHGPCRAVVVAESLRLESGSQRFRITETWEPPQPGFGAITETTMVDDAVVALREAKKSADEWGQGTARSHRLAPNGRLRAPVPRQGPGVMRVPASALELVDPKP